jgi:hypothetical protein
MVVRNDLSQAVSLWLHVIIWPYLVEGEAKLKLSASRAEYRSGISRLASLTTGI